MPEWREALTALNQGAALHEMIGVFLLVTALASWTLCGYLVRAEAGARGWREAWRRPGRTLPLGMALAGRLGWDGVLNAALGLLVMFGSSAIPWWSVAVVSGLFVSTLLLMRVYAREEARR